MPIENRPLSRHPSSSLGADGLRRGGPPRAPPPGIRGEKKRHLGPPAGPKVAVGILELRADPDRRLHLRLDLRVDERDLASKSLFLDGQQLASRSGNVEARLNLDDLALLDLVRVIQGDVSFSAQLAEIG